MRAVNLIPTDERGGSGITAGRSGGSAYVVLVLLGGLAACALIYGLSARQISSRKTQISSLTAQARQAQARAAVLAPYTSFIAMREQRVQAVSQLVDSRFDWAQAFHELGRVLPPNKVSLTSLDGTVGSTSSTLGPPAGPKGAASSSAGAAATATTATATVTSATPPGSVPVFTLTGCATSQAEVALMLERLRLIAGVSEVTLQSSTKTGSAAAGGAGAGGAGGAACASGDPEFNAQVTFDALPSTPAASPSGSGTSVSASVSGVGASAPASGAVR
jgi:Tfp pilus assembly protein PilN